MAKTIVTFFYDAVSPNILDKAVDVLLNLEFFSIIWKEKTEVEEGCDCCRCSVAELNKVCRLAAGPGRQIPINLL